MKVGLQNLILEALSKIMHRANDTVRARLSGAGLGFSVICSSAILATVWAKIFHAFAELCVCDIYLFIF